jgi:hypothetical protein
LGSVVGAGRFEQRDGFGHGAALRQWVAATNPCYPIMRQLAHSKALVCGHGQEASALVM